MKIVDPVGIGPEGDYCPFCGVKGQELDSFGEGIGEYMCQNWDCPPLRRRWAGGLKIYKRGEGGSE